MAGMVAARLEFKIQDCMLLGIAFGNRPRGARPDVKECGLEDAGQPATRPGGRSRASLTRDAWLEAARKVLEKKGIAAVKVDQLARQLKVTRGSFYFHFSALKDLQDGLVELWRQRNCAPFLALEQGDLRGEDLFAEVFRIWVSEESYSPPLDLAIRDWGRSSRTLAAEMEAADALRIALLARAFREMGYGEDESIVRARISYLHQIGYYAVGFREPAADRKRYQPIYGKVLVGEPDGSP